jgi:flagellar biosynthetic protein FliR
MAGVIFFNPIFGRRNIPSLVKVGLSLGIALNVYMGMSDVSVINYTGIDLFLSMVKEFAIGFSMGFVIQVFLSIFQLGGELIDMQMGIGMAMMYDPTSNSQISITGNLMTIMYTLIFFISNSHITLIYIAVSSYKVIPIGLQPLSPDLSIFFIELFGYILIYAVQLAMPIIATEIIVEVVVGILMRFVPNINVFVINLQIKLLVGITVLLTIIPVLVGFMGEINSIMMETVQRVIMHMV